jgi:hypothetical protein
VLAICLVKHNSKDRQMQMNTKELEAFTEEAADKTRYTKALK